MSILSRCALLILLLLPFRAAAGAEIPGGTIRMGEGTVAEVLDGTTVRMEDGSIVRLAGLRTPLADVAREALAGLALGRAVELRRAKRDRDWDRHGRTVAHLVREDGLWIQDALLRQGMAQHYSQSDINGLSAELSEAERAARSAKRGLWADPAFQPRDAKLEAAWTDAIGGYHLAVGTVLAAERRRERLYLNFGTDWRRDFTVEIATRDLRRFAGAGLDPLTWQGKRLEVRGWVESYNGPLIRVTHPQQIEFVGD
ncbi:thermonuclease family protein [Indioceanicola profundi]|uniref:thermonuclease family protein n=1 Tax=Indioceanicola profundi TaxID=2220096 RepID=UPI000E6AB081|nr:thermonuclease family protein [Indioceanicola profundi]